MKAQIDMQYAAFIRILGLSGEQGEKLKESLMARNTAMQDAFTAAVTSGLDPRTPEFQELLNKATGPATDNLKSQLGDAGYASLQNYEQTQGQRNVVNQLQQQLVPFGASALLTDAQSEQLVQVLANSQGGNQGRGGNNLLAATGATAMGF